MPLRPKYKKIAVLGGGSWGTALVKILTDNKVHVFWYVRSPEKKDFIEKNRHNPGYLSAVPLKLRKITISNNLNEVVSHCTTLIAAIPSAFLAEELKKIDIPLDKHTVFSAVKGVVPESLSIIGEYFYDVHRIPWNQIGMITGPSHAEEIAMERLSYLTVACQDTHRSKQMRNALKNQYVRVKMSTDVVGAEYAAMLKNIYAIAAGIAHGLGYGDNFQSVLMSNSIREMKQFIKDVHKSKRNINDSAYLGDLLVTGYSTFSRNRTFGNMIGKGYTVHAAQMEMNMIAEGYYATKSAKIINRKFKSKIPIANAVHAILYEKKKPEKVFKQLSKKLN